MTSTSSVTSTTAGSPDSNGAADASQKPKRVRTSKPKVKTGCNNCKQRRIKCDESRPSCTQCVRSKKICTGYPPPSRSARPFEEIKIAPKPSPITPAGPPPGRAPVQLPPRRVVKYQRRATPPQTPTTQTTSVVLYRPSLNLPFNEEEGLYFQLFREQTASELSGFFDSVFWTRSVLQECHNEASIRHAVVALGALYKTLEKGHESPPSSPADGRDPDDGAYKHWEVAVKQYSHACNSLLVVNSQDPGAHRTRLMLSVLLACFDSFIGDHKQAIWQIQSGLRLLDELRAERRRSFLPQPGEPVEKELVQMFTRLAIQAKSYDMAFHFPQPYVIRLTQRSTASDGTSPSSDGASPSSQYHDPMPEQFTSLLEARVAWDNLLERILKFTEHLFAFSSADSPMGVLPMNLRQYGAGFKDQIQAWSDAFDHILISRTAPGFNSQEKAGIAVLKMFQIMSQILFLMTFSDSELQFDNFLAPFKNIIDLALEVVGDEERRAAAKRCPDPLLCQHQHRHGNHYASSPDSSGSGSSKSVFGGHEWVAHHIKPSFSADLGIVPPLFVVATKCRHPVTRRQAIQLLKSSARREGMWDSELSARIGMWVAEIEEEDVESPLLLLTPERSPIAGSAHPAATAGFGGLMPNGGAMAGGLSASGFEDGVPLGPGGNARWDARRESHVAHLTAAARIPDERRVMVRAAEFDLKQRVAYLQCGSRSLPEGASDLKSRETKITW